MPSDDLVLNVRQIAGYTAVGGAAPSDALLIQRGGLGGPYASISPADLVATALSSGGDMVIGGSLTAFSLSGGNLQFSNGMIAALSAQKACIVNLAANVGTIGGIPIATTLDVAATVTSFNLRTGPVQLWLEDILCAGGAPIFSPRFSGNPRAATPCPESNSTRLATTAYVQTAIQNLVSGEAFVTTFNGRVGAVTLTAADVLAADPPYAPIDSPNFTGYASAPTAPLGTRDGQIATTAFVMNAVSESTTGVVSFNTRSGTVVLTTADITGAGGAVLASPAFTGVPTAPTAATGTDTDQLATCAFVNASTSGGYAPINSPAFTGTPTAPTPAVGTNTTQIATTAYVLAAITAVDSGVVSFNGRTGVVSLLANDISAAGGAVLASPAFTGAPTAPTAAVGTSTTQLATTAFVMAQIAAAGGVSTFNGRAGAVTLTVADVNAAGGPYLPTAGGTMTGLVTFADGIAVGWGSNSISCATANQSIAINGGTAFGANSSFILNGGGRPTYTFEWYAGAAARHAALDGSGNFNLFIGVGIQPGGGPWAATSDARTKTVLGDYEQGLDDVLTLRPIRYVYRGNDTTEDRTSPHAKVARDRTPFVGLVAQEIEAVFPGMVTKTPGIIDGRAVNDLRIVNTTELVFALVNAIKALAARVATLEAA